jgi:3-deoxy-D-manno-octulosonic-acid transferase
MMALYSFGLALALALASPWWLARMLTSGRYREGLGERLGFGLGRVQGQGVVWVHAVSVGEVLAAGRLIESLKAKGLDVVVSTTTRAGQQLARQRFGADKVFYFPLDLRFAVRAVLRAVKPQMLVLMESELWPRVLVECERAGIPVAVVNARVSDRSLPRYVALRKLWRPLLAKVRLLLAQTEEDARRWAAIGACNVIAVGNLKYDSAPPKQSEVVEEFYRQTDEVILVCGSTLEGEEKMLLDCWKALRNLGILVLAPRHPQRFPVIEALIEELGFRCHKLSLWKIHPEKLIAGDVVLVDTIGDLAALYDLGCGAFIGGSLVNAGGHNPLEPAMFEVPVMMGPHYQNFREIVDRMIAADAIKIVTQGDLCSSMEQMMASPDVAMGVRGREFFVSQAGATEHVMAHLLPVLHEVHA